MTQKFFRFTLPADDVRVKNLIHDLVAAGVNFGRDVRALPGHYFAVSMFEFEKVAAAADSAGVGVIEEKEADQFAPGEAPDRKKWLWIGAAALVGFWLFSCQSGGRDAREIRLVRLSEAVVIAQAGSVDSDACAAWTPLNGIYFPEKYNLINVDWTRYQNVILGDSTLDISCRYPGWFNPQTTQCDAVAGNTLCDMSIQMRAVHSPDPAAVVIGTAGGNDILKGVPAASIGQTAALFIQKVRTRWPAARIVMLSAHPTLVTSANAVAVTTNADIKSNLAGYSNTCWIDTRLLFAGPPAVGSVPAASDMLDSIHYAENISIAVKSAVQGQCGVTL